MANRKTIVRRFLFEAAQAKAERLAEFEVTDKKQELSHIQFDEMETFERSKCLPLSIPIAVDPKTRKILGAKVASMSAKGLLAEKSRKKYGHRKDDRESAVKSLFAEISSSLCRDVRILSDKNPNYPDWIKTSFPDATHNTVKGRRANGTGQGELKTGGFDPLFGLNHTAAMLRANINRLVRKTWCTTKRKDRLEAHIELYIKFHNTELIPQVAA